MGQTSCFCIKNGNFLLGASSDAASCIHAGFYYFFNLFFKLFFCRFLWFYLTQSSAERLHHEYKVKHNLSALLHILIFLCTLPYLKERALPKQQWRRPTITEKKTEHCWRRAAWRRAKKANNQAKLPFGEFYEYQERPLIINILCPQKPGSPFYENFNTVGSSKVPKTFLKKVPKTYGWGIRYNQASV